MYGLDLAREHHRERLRDAESYRRRRQLRGQSARRRQRVRRRRSARLGLVSGALVALGLLGAMALPWSG